VQTLRYNYGTGVELIEHRLREGSPLFQVLKGGVLLREFVGRGEEYAARSYCLGYIQGHKDARVEEDER